MWPLNLQKAPSGKQFVLLLSLLLFVRLSIGPLTQLPIFYDEAYYHLWAQQLDWGYYSKPPMVAWLIALTTTIFGHVEWAVRLAAPLLYVASSLVIYRLASELFSRQVGFAAALLFITTPLVSFNSLFITTDAPLLFFWALCAYFTWTALQTNQWTSWLLAGVFGGLGLLSKYTMGVLALSLLLFLLTDKAYRSQLVNGKLWMAALIAGVIFAPNLWWNYQYDFISFQHTSEISHLDRQLFNFDKLAEFFFGQLGVMGPVAFVVLWLGMRRLTLNSQVRYALLIGLPMLLIICLQAFLARAHVNWAAPAYVGLSILFGYLCVNRSWHNTYSWAIAINLVIGTMFYAYPSIQTLLGVDATRTNTPYHRILGYRELAQQLQLPDSMPVLSNRRAILSYLHYYQSDWSQHQQLIVESLDVNNHIDDHYDLKMPMSDIWPKLLVIDQSLPVAQCFADAHLQQVAKVPQLPGLDRTWYVWNVAEFSNTSKCREVFSHG